MPDVKPTWLRYPLSSYRPRSSDPTTLESLPYLKPPTTQSAVRINLYFCITRLPGTYGSVRCLATIPSIYQPDECSHFMASMMELVRSEEHTSELQSP